METHKAKQLTPKELRYWMNFYHDKWLELHNKYEVMPESRNATKATNETEHFVNNYIKKYGLPPTYQTIVDHFGLKSKSAAYARCRNIRCIMSRKGRKILDKSEQQ